MSVPFRELSDSPRWNVTSSGTKATRVGLIAWTDIDAFVVDLFPPTVITGTVNVQASGKPFPGFPWLRADSMTLEPFPQKILGPVGVEDFDTIPAYEFAKATINYATPLWTASNIENSAQNTPDPVPFLRHRWTCGAEYLTIPNRSLVWNSDGVAVPQEISAGIRIPTEEIQITWPHVFQPPFAAIRNCVGKVNSNFWTFATGTFDPETVLFLGAELEREVMSDGSRAWTVSYRFSERRVYPQDQCIIGGWNHFWRPDRGGFYRMTIGYPNNARWWCVSDDPNCGISSGFTCQATLASVTQNSTFPGGGTACYGPYTTLAECSSTCAGTTTTCANTPADSNAIFQAVNFSQLFPTGT